MSSILDRFAIPEKPPPRLVIYGDEKIGKTTFAASAPDIAMIEAEDGALGLDTRQTRVHSWQETLDVARLLVNEDHEFKWAALDTINAIEAMCGDMVCRRDFNGRWFPERGKDEAFHAWGKGNLAVANEFRALLALCDQMQQQRGMGVILLCHVGLHKTGNALGADFVKFGGDVSKNLWALLVGWADQIGWATREFRASIRDEEKRAKASAIGAAREIFFEGQPGLYAGCRAGYEMPERILLDWQEYERQLKADHVGDLVAQVNDLLESASEKTIVKITSTLGEKITNKALRGIGKQRLNALISWMLQQQQNNNGAERVKEEAA